MTDSCACVVLPLPYAWYIPLYSYYLYNIYIKSCVLYIIQNMYRPPYTAYSLEYKTAATRHNTHPHICINVVIRFIHRRVSPSISSSGRSSQLANKWKEHAVPAQSIASRGLRQFSRLAPVHFYHSDGSSPSCVRVSENIFYNTAKTTPSNWTFFYHIYDFAKSKTHRIKRENCVSKGDEQ